MSCILTDGGASWGVTTIDLAHYTLLTAAVADVHNPGNRYDPAIAFDTLGNLTSAIHSSPPADAGRNCY